MSETRICVAILGPTASGKSAFAAQLAALLKTEILCMDSTTVYRGFDIGSAKPSESEKAAAPHHLIDILDPDEPFSAFHFVQAANGILDTLQDQGKIPVVVGGTYFYLRALQHGMYDLPVIPAEVIEKIEKEFFEDDTLQTQRMHERLNAIDPEAAKNIHSNDRYRLLRALSIFEATGKRPSDLTPVPLSPRAQRRIWLKYALFPSRGQLTQAIIRRAEKMLAAGIVPETERLLEKHPNARALGSVGYAEAVQFLKKNITEKQLRNEIIEKTRQLAKRQVTWLRSDPEVRFVDFRDAERILKDIENLSEALKGN